MNDRQAENDVINFTLEHWGGFVVGVLAQKIKDRKLVLTGELLKSLQFEVLKASGEATAKLLLAFEESGRIRDMRNTDRRKQAPIEVMEAFVREVGVGRFSNVPSYRSMLPRKTPTESQIVNRIAWGIVRKQRMNQNNKPKKWFAKPFYGTIHALIDNLLIGYQDMSASAITENLGVNGIG